MSQILPVGQPSVPHSTQDLEKILPGGHAKTAFDLSIYEDGANFLHRLAKGTPYQMRGVPTVVIASALKAAGARFLNDTFVAKPDLRQKYIDVLASRGGQEEIATLFHIMKEDANPIVREHAFKRLIKIGGGEIITTLVEAYSNNEIRLGDQFNWEWWATQKLGLKISERRQVLPRSDSASPQKVQATLEKVGDSYQERKLSVAETITRESLVADSEIALGRPLREGDIVFLVGHLNRDRTLSRSLTVLKEVDDWRMKEPYYFKIPLEYRDNQFYANRLVKIGDENKQSFTQGIGASDVVNFFVAAGVFKKSWAYRLREIYYLEPEMALGDQVLFI